MPVEQVGHEVPLLVRQRDHVALAPRIGGRGDGVRVARRAERGHEQLGGPDLARVGVDDRDRRARVVDEQLLAGPVVVAHDDVEVASPAAVVLDELGVAIAIGVVFAVLDPERLPA